MSQALAYLHGLNHPWLGLDLGNPKIKGTPLGVPIIRIIVFWGLDSGPPYFEKLPFGESLYRGFGLEGVGFSGLGFGIWVSGFGI